MNRNFHLVDYATEMSSYCPSVINLNEEFTMTSGHASSPHLTTSSFGNAFNTFNFNDNIDGDVFIQKFEELNPLINYTKLGHRIFPNINFTIPNGFILTLESLIPGIVIKHIKSIKRIGVPYSINDVIKIPKSPGVGVQEVRLIASPSYYYMQQIQEIVFVIEKSDYIICTKTGFKFLKDSFPETDILNINFKCLHKELPENYEDMPKTDPVHGCDNEFFYNRFEVIRNATLFNYMYIH